MSENKQAILAMVLGTFLFLGYGVFMESCKKTEVIEEPPRVDETRCVKCHEPFIYEMVEVKHCSDCHRSKHNRLDTCRYAGF